MKPSPSRFRPWYREPWPWLLIAAPAASIVMGLVLWALAVSTDDGLVANDYYKRGLAINQKLKHVPAIAEPRLGATLRVAGNGEVSVRLEGMTSSSTESPSIRLKLAQPTRAAPDQVIILTREASGDYVGMLNEQTTGRWIVTLESDGWRLPTTTGLGRISKIQFGLVAKRS